MTTIGIVGCGAIGQALLKAAQGGQLPVTVVGVTSRSRDRADAFLATLQTPPPYLELADLIAQSDLVIEAAAGSIVPELAEQTFAAGKDLMVISIGALIQHPEAMDMARKANCRLYAPSGAIAGLDGLKSASIGEIYDVTMTSRKPPHGLEGAPYLLEHEISLEGLTEEREVFYGNALEAAKGFPSNLNVSAAVGLAGVGFERTMVRLIAVPGLDRNCHDVRVEGEFGLLTIHVENIPSENPKTGRLTAMSIIRAVKDVADPVRIGN
jgi:aspartate dehydrogenase